MSDFETARLSSHNPPTSCLSRNRSVIKHMAAKIMVCVNVSNLIRIVDNKLTPAQPLISKVVVTQLLGCRNPVLDAYLRSPHSLHE